MHTTDPEIPTITQYTFDRLIGAGGETSALSRTYGGHLQVVVRGEMLVRPTRVLAADECLQLRPVASRTSAPEAARTFACVRVIGDGVLVVAREGGEFIPLRLREDTCFFASDALWALEPSLSWEIGALPGSRRDGAPIELVRVKGTGLVALRVASPILAVKVTPGSRRRILADALVGWIGGVVVGVDDDRDFLRCEGEGAVYVSDPEAGGEGTTR
ncbi:MAG: AIM24 family protein [Nannocystaceae bacterium]|nr:AIM24 family protein [Myxococcales bacterium]